MRDALGIAGICELLPDFKGGNASRIRSFVLIGRRGLTSPGKRKRKQEPPSLSGPVILRRLFARWNTPRHPLPGRSSTLYPDLALCGGYGRVTTDDSITLHFFVTLSIKKRNAGIAL